MHTLVSLKQQSWRKLQMTCRLYLQRCFLERRRLNEDVWTAINISNSPYPRFITNVVTHNLYLARISIFYTPVTVLQPPGYSLHQSCFYINHIKPYGKLDLDCCWQRVLSVLRAIRYGKHVLGLNHFCSFINFLHFDDDRNTTCLFVCLLNIASMFSSLLA